MALILLKRDRGVWDSLCWEMGPDSDRCPQRNPPLFDSHSRAEWIPALGCHLFLSYFSLVSQFDD